MKKLILFLLLVPTLSFGQWKHQVFYPITAGTYSPTSWLIDYKRDYSKFVLRYNISVIARDINRILFGTTINQSYRYTDTPKN